MVGGKKSLLVSCHVRQTQHHFRYLEANLLEVSPDGSIAAAWQSGRDKKMEPAALMVEVWAASASQRLCLDDLLKLSEERALCYVLGFSLRSAAARWLSRTPLVRHPNEIGNSRQTVAATLASTH